MDLFQTACTCTISMATSGTTICPTCSSWMVPSISPIICERTRAPSLKRRVMRRRSGMGVRLGASGIINTMNSSREGFISASRAHVTNAAQPTKRSITDVTDFAPTTVNLHGGAPKDWTERSAPVVVAEPYSPAISTFLHEHADVFAVPVCAGVDALHVSDTYCMEVPHGNAFAVEGGILVHNCMRYLVASKGEYARAVPVPAQPKSGALPGFVGRGGWMRG